MIKALFARIALLGVLLLGTISLAHAQTAPMLDSTLCNQLYGLPAGTIATTVSQQYLNPAVCAAMNDLISRYNPGSASSIGLTNAKVQGITSLNSAFALNLDNMLKAADAAGYHITINSAYRTVAGEAAANPTAAKNGFVSMHSKGLAADLQYPNDGNVLHECDGAGTNLSPAYKWVSMNAGSYNIGLYDQLHSHVNGECNHVEAKSSDGTQGPGNPGGAGISVPQTTQTPIYSIPGLGSTPTTGMPGQISNQDSYCIVSTDPLVTVPVPAGTPFPSGCFNSAQTSSILQSYCSGNTIVYNFSGNPSAGQTCPAGCMNGACMQVNQQTSQQASQQTSQALHKHRVPKLFPLPVRRLIATRSDHPLFAGQ